MKAVLGDVHGRDYWKRVINKDYSDIYILGDYWDSHDKKHTFAIQERNFTELIAAAEKDKRIHLCLGNHDLHYICPEEEYSGYQTDHAADIYAHLINAMPLLRVAYQDSGYVISHAGISKTFMEQTGCKTIEDIQRRFDEDNYFLGFCGDDPYGDDATQGPLWIRPNSLVSGPAFPKQIVGHTPFKEILIFKDKKNKDINIVFVDTGDTCSVYEFE